MKLTSNEEKLLTILIHSQQPLTWSQIRRIFPLINRSLRVLKENLVLKGVPVGSKSGKKCFSSGASLSGGIYLIRSVAELKDARAQYEAQAKRELQHAAQLETNFNNFYNENLFGEV